MRYFLKISYNGTGYHGWQIQPNAITVQEVLQHALSKLLRDTIAITGAGRTDTGVHASCMYAHFDSKEILGLKDLSYKLNAFLPKDIAVHDIIEVTQNAHARFDALSRQYHYKIHQSKNVFKTKLSYYFKQELAIDKMNTASKILMQYEDFECFSRTHTDVKTFLCKVTKAEWVVNNDELIFMIQADRFLRNMVRAIVGTLLDIGQEKKTIEDLHKIIKSKERSQAGASAPAHGLYLTEIQYANSIFVS